MVRPLMDLISRHDYIFIRDNQMHRQTPSKITVATSRETEPQTEQEIAAIAQHKEKTARIIAVIFNRHRLSRLAEALQRTWVIPSRELRIQKRMKRAIEGVFKRQDYLSKWEGFQNIRRAALTAQKQEHLHLKATLKKQRGTAIKLMTSFMLGKKRDNLHSMLALVRERADIRQHLQNNNFRKGLRAMVRLCCHKMSDTFFRIKDSRAIMGQKSKLRNVLRIMKEIRIQNMRWAFVLTRREMIRNRQERAKEEIKELDEKLGVEEDEELTGLQNRYKDLCRQVEEVKKDREEIQAKLNQEIKDAEQKKADMKEHVEQLRHSQEEMKKKIAGIDEQLKAPFSLGEIYQLCYENLLWTMSQTTSKTLNRDELLKSLEIPLVPIDLPLEQLREENKVMGDLLSEYVVMYGEKKLPVGCKLELPYEYLLKENNLLYKMLMTLLPNAKMLGSELSNIRETYQSVQKMVKECTQ